MTTYPAPELQRAIRGFNEDKLLLVLLTYVPHQALAVGAPPAAYPPMKIRRANPGEIARSKRTPIQIVGPEPPSRIAHGVTARLKRFYGRPVKFVRKAPVYETGEPAGPKRGRKGILRFYPNDNMHPVPDYFGRELLKRWRRRIKSSDAPEDDAIQAIATGAGVPDAAVRCALDRLVDGSHSGRGVARVLTILRPDFACSPRTMKSLLRSWRSWHNMTCCKDDPRWHLLQDAHRHLSWIKAAWGSKDLAPLVQAVLS